MPRQMTSCSFSFPPFVFLYDRILACKSATLTGFSVLAWHQHIKLYLAAVTKMSRAFHLTSEGCPHDTLTPKLPSLSLPVLILSFCDVSPDVRQARLSVRCFHPTPHHVLKARPMCILSNLALSGGAGSRSLYVFTSSVQDTWVCF